MPTLKKLHDPVWGEMRIAALMSGSGTNLVKILEHQAKLEKERGRSPFQVVVIFSDNKLSQAAVIGEKYDLPVVVNDIESFYRKKQLPRNDLAVRGEYDSKTVEMLIPYNVSFAAYAGYMSVASPVLVNAYTGINVHPADLGVDLPDGTRRWTGAHAVADAVQAGEKYLHSSTHIVEEQVDYGRLLLISGPLGVQIPGDLNILKPQDLRAAERLNKERLKEHGDWVIFPLTLEYIADGRIAENDSGIIHFDGCPIPKGLRL